MSLNANQFTTDKVRLSYVHLNQPHSSAPDSSNPKYGVTILLPKSDVATKARLDAAYQAAVNAGVGAKWNGVMPPKIESPIYDGDGVRPNGEPFGAECKGHWVFTAGNKNPVPIVDIGQNPVVNAGDIYSGMYARVCVSFYAYNFSGKRGIGCGLEAVQKRRALGRSCVRSRCLWRCKRLCRCGCTCGKCSCTAAGLCTADAEPLCRAVSAGGTGTAVHSG